jgi:hypothetical protein
MTREDRDLSGLVVPGSDHLTAYNLYMEAYSRCGYIGEVYGLPRHLFDETVERWAEKRGVLVKAIEDAALAAASIYRSLGMELPTKMMPARDHIYKRFTELLAQYMPFDLVINEETADGTEARVSKTSVCGSWGPIAGDLRYFADRNGNPRAAIEGTQVPAELIRKYATRSGDEIIYDSHRKHAPLVIRRKLEYFGFELEREMESIEEFPEGQEQTARRVLAEALARGEARHHAVRKNAPAIEMIREAYKRSGGETVRLGQAQLAQLYEEQLADVRSYEDFKNARLVVDVERFVPQEVASRIANLPMAVMVRDREIAIDYDVEEKDGMRTAVARLRLPQKIAKNLTEMELPSLDRPIRFVVLRGQRGAVRADTLEELQEELEKPWSPDEVEPHLDDELAGREEREVRKVASEFRHRRPPKRSHGARPERGGGNRHGKSGRNRSRRRR